MPWHGKRCQDRAGDLCAENPRGLSSPDRWPQVPWFFRSRIESGSQSDRALLVVCRYRRLADIVVLSTVGWRSTLVVEERSDEDRKVDPGPA